VRLSAVALGRSIHAASCAVSKLFAVERTSGRPTRIEVWDPTVSSARDQGDQRARVAFDGHRRRTATASDSTLLIHELATDTQPAKLVATKTLQSNIRDVVIDDKAVATCGSSGVAVWALDKLGAEPARFAADCTLIAFLDPGRVVFANKKYELQLWTVGQPSTDRTMSGHITINVLAVNRTQRRIATGDATGVVMWNWKGDALGESRDITGGIDKLAFTTDGEAFVGAGADDRVFVWDTASFHSRQAFGGSRGAISGSRSPTARSLLMSSGRRSEGPRRARDRSRPERSFAVAGDQLVTSLPQGVDPGRGREDRHGADHRAPVRPDGLTR
jgi:WD40 repeat protein